MTDRAWQTALSGAERPFAEEQAIELAGASRSQTTSKVQRRFARLIKKIDQRKQRLRAWYDVRSEIHRELAAYHALLETYRDVGRDFVCRFDDVYMHPRLTKPERKKLRTMLCEIARDLLGEPDDDDLMPIDNHRHLEFDAEGREFDAEDREFDAEDREFNPEAAPADAAPERAVNSPMETYTEAEIEAEILAIEQEEAQHEAKAEAGPVLQEIYRKLAVSLDPDLEQDPARRARKTELMQQLNIAYEVNDLLRILDLQLDLEQIDPDRTSEVAEDRLQHSNTILEQQLKDLEAELDNLEMRWQREADLFSSTSAHLEPLQVLDRIRSDSEKVQQETAALRANLEAFQDIVQLKTWLKSPTAHLGRGRAEQEDLAEQDDLAKQENLAEQEDLTEQEDLAEQDDLAEQMELLTG